MQQWCVLITSGGNCCVFCVSGSACRTQSATGPAHRLPRFRRRSLRRTTELNSHPLHGKSEVKLILHMQQSTQFQLCGTRGFKGGLGSARGLLTAKFTVKLQINSRGQLRSQRHQEALSVSSRFLFMDAGRCFHMPK